MVRGPGIKKGRIRCLDVSGPKRSWNRGSRVSRLSVYELFTGSLKNNGLFRELLTLLDTTYPARQITRIYVGADNHCIHKANAVEQWLTSHPRCALLWLP